MVALVTIQNKLRRESCFGLLTALLFAFSNPVFADDYYSKSNGLWNSPSNWAIGSPAGPDATVPPTSADFVYISSGHTITVSADAEAMFIDNSGTIIVNHNITLTVQGNVIIQSAGKIYLSGNTTCNGNNVSVLIVNGNYSNYGISCFWKSWVIIAGDLYSPEASGIQNNGFLVIGGNAIGEIDQTGGSSVYTLNPLATVTLTGTTPIITPPASPAGLVTIVSEIISGSSCPLTMTGPANVCSTGSADFEIFSTSSSSPSYSWEEHNGYGWNPLTDGGVYSGTDSAILHISNVTGKNGYLYKCKITDSCYKYSSPEH